MKTCCTDPVAGIDRLSSVPQVGRNRSAVPWPKPNLDKVIVSFHGEPSTAVAIEWGSETVPLREPDTTTSIAVNERVAVQLATRAVRPKLAAETTLIR